MDRPLVGAFEFFEPPRGRTLVLEVAPQLASWDRAGARSQVRLARFLAHVDAQLRSAPFPEAPVSFALEVMVSPTADLTEAGDLDNFVYPLARLLGPDRIASAWASKAQGSGPSTFRLAAARPASSDQRAGWASAWVHARGSATARAWKAQIRDQVAAQCGGVAPDGPLELEVAFRVGPRRSWANLWKPAIDALGPVLGIVTPRRPFHPRDGRIVRLGLHRSVVPDLGDDVQLAFRWRLAPAPR